MSPNFPAMMPSSDHRHHEEPKTRDWTALPQDILFAVFLKLKPLEVLRRVDHVCTAWRRVAVGEPGLWRRLDMGTVALSRCRAAVFRGAGQCESFAARCDSNDSLFFLVRGAPSLKTLRLLDANVSCAALIESIQKLAQLEELEVDLPYFGLWYKKLVRCICEARPQLKRLSVTVLFSLPQMCRGGDRLVIPLMCELRALKLTDQHNFAVDELVAIVDNCPLLESHHISRLQRNNLEQLRERCKAKNLTITS